MRVQTALLLLAAILALIPQTSRTQASLHVGEVRQGSLTHSDKRLKEDGSFYDRYLLQARGGQRITIELKSQAFLPYLVLLDQDGTEIASSCGKEATHAARIKVTLPYTGKYHIRVNSLRKGGLGRYTLKIK